MGVDIYPGYFFLNQTIQDKQPYNPQLTSGNIYIPI